MRRCSKRVSKYPKDCFVKIEWEKNNDLEYVEEKLKYAWEHRDKLSRNGREWYLKNCGFNNWIKIMRKLIG